VAAAWARYSKTDRCGSFPFAPEALGRELTAYDSSGVLFSVLVRSSGETQLTCLRLGPGGKVGPHPAPVPQVFAVVARAGEAVPEAAGQAVFWEA
jgi:hypothetical protein